MEFRFRSDQSHMRSNTDQLQPFVPGRSLTPAMTLGRLFLCSLLLVGASSGHVLQAADAARPLRVALMNFTSDDNSYRSSETERRAWFNLVQMLEAACFIDPTSQKAREWWLRVRWGSDTGLSARNSFVFHRRRSEEWRRFIGQFGLQPASPFVPPHSQDNASAAANYVLSAARVFEIVCLDQKAQARMGVPRDTGGKEITEWRERLGTELAQRLI